MLVTPRLVDRIAKSVYEPSALRFRPLTTRRNTAGTFRFDEIIEATWQNNSQYVGIGLPTPAYLYIEIMTGTHIGVCHATFLGRWALIS